MPPPPHSFISKALKLFALSNRTPTACLVWSPAPDVAGWVSVTLSQIRDHSHFSVIWRAPIILRPHRQCHQCVWCVPSTKPSTCRCHIPVRSCPTPAHAGQPHTAGRRPQRAGAHCAMRNAQRLVSPRLVHTAHTHGRTRAAPMGAERMRGGYGTRGPVARRPRVPMTC